MTDWSHPRIANPAAALEVASETLAAEARAAFRRRVETYPRAVEAGTITAEEARADIEAWRAVARDWHYIAFGEGEPARRDTLAGRTAALDTAIARWLDQVDRHGGTPTEAENEQGLCLCALRIWSYREHTLPPYEHRRWYAALGHHWRAESGHPTRGALLAARDANQEGIAA